MFSFFKKKNLEKNIGAFTSYGMEDVYQFLSEFRVQDKITELKDVPTLGTKLEDFVSEVSVASPSGEFHFFTMLLYYFRNDLDLALYLFEKSKLISEYNYLKKQTLKSIWKDHFDLMDRLAKRKPENAEVYLLRKRPIYWLEYDLFYFGLLKNFIFNFNLNKFYNLQVEGEFDRKGSKIFSPVFEISYRANKNSKTGYYLTLKSKFLLSDIKIDLVEGTDEESFTFDTLFASYEIALFKQKAVVSKVKSFSNKKIDLIISTRFIDLISELSSNYIENFDKISERLLNDVSKPDINFFFFILLKFDDLDSDTLLKVKEILKSKKEIWGNIERYYSGSILA